MKCAFSWYYDVCIWHYGLWSVHLTIWSVHLTLWSMHYAVDLFDRVCTAQCVIWLLRGELKSTTHNFTLIPESFAYPFTQAQFEQESGADTSKWFKHCLTVRQKRYYLVIFKYHLHYELQLFYDVSNSALTFSVYSFCSLSNKTLLHVEKKIL